MSRKSTNKQKTSSTRKLSATGMGSSPGGSNLAGFLEGCQKANRVYFRFLGLNQGESCEDTILEAARRMNEFVAERAPFNPEEVLERKRFEIALATYRLLDPRRRASLRERVQLARPLNREDRIERVVPDGELFALVNFSHDANESAEASATSELLQPRIEQAMNEPADSPVKVDSKQQSQSWLEERRDVVRVIRQEPGTRSDSVKRTDKTGLSWWLSRFGL